MRKVIAAVLLTGAMLVACSMSSSEDATRIRPDAGPSAPPGSGDGHHGRRDAGVLDGGAPDDGPLSNDGGPLPSDCGVPGDGPLPTDDGGAPGDGPLASDGGGPPGDAPPPTHDGGYPR
jgi:hypothetical protein